MAAEPGRIAQECVEGYLYAGSPPRLLILRRPPVRGSIWVPVSGKVETGDGGFESAVTREIAEETGFRSFRRFFPLDWHVAFDGPDGRRWRLHAYAAELPSELPPVLSPEHDAFAWVGLEEADHRLHYEDNRAAVRRLAMLLSHGAAPGAALR